MAPELLPTPLPDNPYQPNTQQDWHDAFATCKRLEAADNWGVFFREPDQALSEDIMFRTSPRIAGRTLGYALIYAPSDVSRHCVAREIRACDGDAEILAGLAHLYIFGFIRLFKNPDGPTPLASAHSSPRASLGAAIESEAQTAVEAGFTPTWLKNALLARDRYHCVLTNKFDLPSAQLGLVEISGGAAYLRAAHIISQPLTACIGGMTQCARDKLQWATSAATVLDRFIGIEVRSILRNLDVHNPLNALSAEANAHIMFDRLELWLTPALDGRGNAVPNTYRVDAQDPLAFNVGLVREVHFHSCMTSDGEEIPPPSPTLLTIHAACARIAHMSGAAEILDEFYRDDDALRALSHSPLDMSFNADSAAVLERALRRIQVGGR